MTKTICSTVFALLVCLLPAMSARAAGTVDSMGFYCTNDPQPGRAWFESFKHQPIAPTQADAAAVAERACAELNMGRPMVSRPAVNAIPARSAARHTVE